MYSIKTILKESFPVLVIGAAISIGAGLILNSNNELLFALPGLLVVIPAFINMNGSILSILSSRISSALHMGLIKPKLKTTKTLNKNLIITAFDSFVSFLLLGFIAGGFNIFFGIPTVDFWIFPFITLTAGLISITLLSVLSITFSYVSLLALLVPSSIESNRL